MENAITNYQSFIDWKDGKPVVVYKEMLTKEVIADLPVATLSTPYQRTDKEIFLNIDPEFENKTNAEVMHIRLARKAAGGSMEAIKILQDRILGKPKQEIETRKLTMSYADYLDQIAKKEEEFQEANINVL